MAKIVFFCIPAHGHTNPTLGVVRALTARGHAVYYYSYDAFRAKIEAAGAKFISCNAYDMELRLDAKQAARIGSDIALSTRVLVDTTLALDEMVCREMQRLQPDCIVADSMAVWGKAVALKLGIPFVSSTTTFAFNRDSAKVMQQGLGDLFRLLLALPKVNRDLKRLRAHGYPVHNILDILQNDNQTHTIVYTSPEFQPSAESFSDRYAFVGPSIRPVEQPIEKTRARLVYVSLGTVVNDQPGFFAKCIDALRTMDAQVILSVGEHVDHAALGELPENITVAAQVDQIAVLEKADAFVTHCGMNSVNESLYFGVPMVMLPQTAEQRGVANRVAQLGAGLKLETITPDGIREAVLHVMNDAQFAQSALHISDSFRKCGGAERAAEKILQVCGAE